MEYLSIKSKNSFRKIESILLMICCFLANIYVSKKEIFGTLMLLVGITWWRLRRYLLWNMIFSLHFLFTKCWRYVWQNKSQPFSIIQLRSWNVYQKLIGFGRKNPSSRSHFLCSTSWVDSWYIPKLVTCASATGVFIYQKCVAFVHHTVQIINLF